MFVCEIVSPSSDWIDAKDNFCFVKNILFKSRNCISALLYRLFYNVKPMLSQHQYIPITFKLNYLCLNEGCFVLLKLWVPYNCY